MKKLYVKIREKIQSFKDKRLKRRVLYGKRTIFGKRKEDGLIKRYEYNYQTEQILEQWIIKRIVEGNTNRRKELAEKQAKIKEMKDFIDYLKKEKL